MGGDGIDPKTGKPKKGGKHSAKSDLESALQAAAAGKVELSEAELEGFRVKPMILKQDYFERRMPPMLIDGQ